MSRPQAYPKAHWSAPVSPNAKTSTVPDSSRAVSADHTFGLADLPPLSDSVGVWPSADTTSQDPGELQQTSYSSVSPPESAFTFNMMGDASAQPFVPADNGVSFVPATAQATYANDFRVMNCADVNVTNTANMQAATQIQPNQAEFMTSINMLEPENDVLAMWSMAPSGFEYVPWILLSTFFL